MGHVADCCRASAPLAESLAGQARRPPYRCLFAVSIGRSCERGFTLAIMRDNYLEEYYSFLRFPSVSTDDKYKEGLVECADWLVNKLNRIGLQTQLVPTKRHPIVWEIGRASCRERV